MADGTDKSESSPTKTKERALPVGSASKFRVGADGELIEYVRSRPVLYDPTHSRYMDNPLKNAIWNKIGKQLKASPSACKRRWYNIRDNYRKALRRRSVNGKLQYKFAHMLGFMDPFYKGQLDVDPIDARESDQLDTAEAETAGSTKTDQSEDDVDNTEEVREEITQKTEPRDVSESEADALSNPSESVVDYDILDTSNVSDSHRPNSSQISQSNEPQSAVDMFLAAIGPMLKGLSPYNLSLAKMEIFATVHKYEMKGIVQNGWAPPDVHEARGSENQ